MQKIAMLVILMVSAQISLGENIIESDNDTSVFEGFIIGKYFLLGKAVNSHKTYFGEITLEGTKSGIKITRSINGKTIKGTAALEKTMGDNVSVLRMRFEENQIKYETTCLISSDLDNYARMTCHVYEPGKSTKNPGLEALFINPNT